MVERVVEAVGRQHGLVVFDEAYQPFSLADLGSTAWARLPHVLVDAHAQQVRPGRRAPRLSGRPRERLIDEIDKVRPPYNISALNAEATLFALEHADEFSRQAALLRSERAHLQESLRALRGVESFPSEANMILVRVADSARVFEGMKRRGVLVKHVAALHPLLAGCLRLTVGTPEENALMIDALRASLP